MLSRNVRNCHTTPRNNPEKWGTHAKNEVKRHDYPVWLVRYTELTSKHPFVQLPHLLTTREVNQTCSAAHAQWQSESRYRLTPGIRYHAKASAADTCKVVRLSPGKSAVLAIFQRSFGLVKWQSKVVNIITIEYYTFVLLFYRKPHVSTSVPLSSTHVCAHTGYEIRAHRKFKCTQK